MNRVIMISFARSGGTLLNKCLGVMPNVVMLSELNPLGGGWGERGSKSYTTVKSQAKNWYNITIESDDFSRSIIELNKICDKQQKKLIIRDWTFVSFVPVTQNNYQPPNTLQALEKLAPDDNNISFAYVRDAIDVWISRGTPDIHEFSKQYLLYVEAIIDSGLPIFKYENFCQKPEVILKTICNKIGINYDDSWQRKYVQFNIVNGDVQSKKSRNVNGEVIKLLPRKKLNKSKIEMIMKCSELQEANKLLGYSTSYFSRPIEKKYFFLKKYFIINVSKRYIKKILFIIKKNKKKILPYIVRDKFLRAYKKWINDQGDQNLRLNYDLTKESIVFDLGGYKGDFAKKIHDKYDCNVYIFEPVIDYYDRIVKRFSNNSKIKIFNFGLSDADCMIDIDLNEDGTSVFTDSGHKEKIILKDIVSFLNKEKIIKIDLMKINIEGGEFQVVPTLIESNLVKNISNLQIQFHTFVENSIKRRDDIRKKLAQTHKLTYDYWFVWENWKLKN